MIDASCTAAIPKGPDSFTGVESLLSVAFFAYFFLVWFVINIQSQPDILVELHNS